MKTPNDMAVMVRGDFTGDAKVDVILQGVTSQALCRKCLVGHVVDSE